MSEAGAPCGPEGGSRGTLAAVVASTLRLGLTSFGGPAAHLGYFHDEWVVRRRWLDERDFADLLALCQFLPGPASSQMVFAIGMQRAGLAGAIAASLCFTLPSALLMICAAYGFAALSGTGAGWLAGLKLAAVAVVAQAVWLMAVRMCPDRLRATFALAAAALVLLWPAGGGQIAAIAAGAFAGWLWLAKAPGENEDGPSPSPTTGEVATPAARSRVAAIGALIAFAVLLLLLPAAARTTGSSGVAAFDVFYRAGSLVFGGGHVVLPLLRDGVVPPGWIGDAAFLAGYGAAQALPGPLFSFSAYLGVLLAAGPGGVAGGLLCLVAIFLPGWLLVGGALPFWQTFRRIGWAQAALRGTNAAVVGVLLAALYDPMWKESVRGPAELSLALTAFAAIAWWRVPPWLVVIACAAAGAALF